MNEPVNGPNKDLNKIINYKSLHATKQTICKQAISNPTVIK